MEQYQQPTNQPIFSLSVDGQSREFLSESARWARFLSIVGFIFCGLIVILGVFFGSMMGRLSSFGGSSDIELSSSQMRSMGGVMAVVYILIAVLYFFPCLYLFRFSNHMRTALAGDDQGNLSASFQNLKSLFKFVGIMTIIVLSIYVIGIIIAILGAGARSAF